MLAQHLDWLVPHHYSPGHDRLITSIHSWLIRTDRHTILLDSCAGNHKDRPGFSRFHQLDTPFLQRLRAAGVPPEEIDIVLCTHLHADHVGWNTMLVDGRWVPTFPNAKYLFSRTENEIGDPARNPAADIDLQRGDAYRDSVLPVIEAGQAVLVDGDHAIEDGLTIVPAPGHARPHCPLAGQFGRPRGALGRRPASSAANTCAALELEILRIAGACPRDPPSADGAMRRASRRTVSRPFWSAARRSHCRDGGGLLPTIRGGEHGLTAPPWLNSRCRSPAQGIRPCPADSA